ncbi:MAG: VCBS repeat-containing protein [Synoicihabitans sp.]
MSGQEIESQALNPRSSAQGAKLFRERSGAETGIVTRNDYADPRMWGDRYQEFALGGMGTGVAIADYDNDGWPDIFIVSKTENSRLFRNLGNWKFEDVTESAGLIVNPAIESGGGLFGGGEEAPPEAWKQGASFADVDNDGWLDLYVCRWGEPNWLFMNQGDGTFREEAVARGLALVDASGVGAFADYDRDGWLDVYVQTNMLNATASPGGQPDHLFRNNGDGTFTDVSADAGIGGNNLAHSTTWWDYNHDGWPDIYIANDFAPADYLYRNNQDGTFTNVIHDVVPTMPYSSMGADQGDINNDGLIDFLVTDMATTSHEKDQRGMASARELSREDSDSPTLAPQTLRNTMFVNTPAHRMLEVANMAGIHATDWTWSVRFEDLDNDGLVDLHVTNGMNREYQNADLRDRIILAENSTVRLRTMKDSPRLNEANLAYRNEGDLRFTEVGAEWGLDKVGISFGVAMADLDRDGDLDIVHSNYGESATILENQSQTGNFVQIALRGTESNRFGVGARVTIETESGKQVRDLVLTRGYLSTSEPVLHFGVGEDEQVERVTVQWPSGILNHFGALEVNRRLVVIENGEEWQRSNDESGPSPQFTVVTEEKGLNFVSKEGPFRENTRQPLVPMRFDRLGPALAVGDLNGDGREDMIMGGTTETPARIIAATSSGKFASASLGKLTQHAVLNDGPILIFEADGDGDADVLVTRTTDALPEGDTEYQPLLLLNSGKGGLSRAPEGTLPNMPASVGALAAADFDRDGDLDIFVGARVKPGAYPEAPRSYLLLNQGGDFTDGIEAISAKLASVGLVTSALWSDVDQDGWIDLLVATEWGHVHAFRNESGVTLSDKTEGWGFAAAGTGWWSSLAAGDFNRDGRMDYVAGNLGLNTPYTASPEEPAVLFYGDFRGRGRGTKRIIEAHYENGRLLPRRTSKAIGAVVPTVRRQFRRNDDFAKATLEEIVGEEKLAAAQRFEATEFRSGVFLSQPDGGFVFSPLPREAQIAPLQGMVVQDFNEDGIEDIYALQNSFAPIPVVGRFDGGLGMLAYGRKGGLFDVSPQLTLSGDTKSLVQIDLDGGGLLDLVGTKNNGSSFATLNHFDDMKSTAMGGKLRYLLVQLSGALTNPNAVGARLTLQLSNDETLIREVTAGGGYFSQNSSRVGFAWGMQIYPSKLTINWPDGTSSEHDIPAEQTVLHLKR